MIPLGDFHQRITSRWSVILLGILPKAFQKNAYYTFLILANLLKHSLRSLWSKPLSVYNSKLLTQPMIHTHPLRGMLSTLLALKKPVTFVTGFVIRIGFEPMALILEG